MEKIKVLIVDDLPDVLTSLERVLNNFKDIALYKATSGKEALSIIDKSKIDLIISDQRMPEMTGIELFKIVKERWPDTVRIIITAYTEVDQIICAINEGEVYRYITKPWNVVELMKTIENVLELIKLRNENRKMQQLLIDQNIKLKNINIELEDRIRKAIKEMKEIEHVTIFALARLAESRDIETGEHLNRIRNYSRLIGERLAKKTPYFDYINEDYLRNLYYSSPLHDIGKVGIPDRILLKPGRLTEEEFEIMKKHTLIGGKTLEDAEKELVIGNRKESFLSMGKNIAYYHHERWDGKGYPFGLSGDSIPLSARIVAVADVYDAMTNKRVYKDPLPHKEAVEIIISEKGKQFDPLIIEVFKECIDDFYQINLKFRDDNSKKFF